jgi:hypothetical protein
MARIFQEQSTRWDGLAPIREIAFRESLKIPCATVHRERQREQAGRLTLPLRNILAANRLSIRAGKQRVLKYA